MDADAALELAALGLSMAGRASSGLALGRRFEGAINQVFELQRGELRYALRVRRNEAGFQYEKGLFKECLLGAVRALRPRFPGAHCDAALQAAVQQVKGRASGEPLGAPAGPTALAFDFTGARYPKPWALFEWAGEVAPDFGESHARALGRLLREVHAHTFGASYPSLLEPGSAVDWTCAAEAELARRLSDLGPRYAAAGDAFVCARAEALAQGALPLVLCHNDLHPLNVLVNGQGALCLIDWDNAVVAPKQLDFVKLRHWSRLGQDGRFVADEAVFAAFCQGYGENPAQILAHPAFQLAELLWLSRVHAFESAREQHAAPAPPFLPARVYAEALGARLFGEGA